MLPQPAVPRFALRVKQCDVAAGCGSASYDNWRETEKQDVVDHCAPHHRLSVAACLEVALQEMECSLPDSSSGSSPSADERTSGTLSGYVVDWGKFYEVAKRANMREKAAVVEHFLVKEYQRYKVAAPVFKSLSRLQDEQGSQMAALMESGGTKESVTQLVEAHTSQLAIAHQAADICLKQLHHQQKHIYRQALESLLDRNPDTFPYVHNPAGTKVGSGAKGSEGGNSSLDAPPGGATPNGRRASLFEFAAPHGGGDAESEQGGAAAGAMAFGSDVVRQINRNIFNPVGKMMRAAGNTSSSPGGAGGQPAGAGLSDMLPFRQRADSNAPESSAASRASPASASPRPQDDGGPVVANTDITADNSAAVVSLTVQAVVGDAVGPVRGMAVECPVRLVNIKTAVATCLAFDPKGQESDKVVVQRRVDVMRRVAKDEMSAWVVPISVHDVARMAGDSSRSFDPYCDMARDIMKVMPPHIVDAATASPDLVFLSLSEGIAESLAALNKANSGSSYFRTALNYSIHPGTVLCTRHSNMPRCQLLLLAIYDPLDASSTRQAIEHAVSLTQNAAQVFVDTTKVAHPELLHLMLQHIVKVKVRSLAVKTPVWKKNFPLHTPSGVKDKVDSRQAAAGGAGLPAGGAAPVVPTLSIVLSATQLASSLDLQKGPFSPFSPTLERDTPPQAQASPRP